MDRAQLTGILPPAVLQYCDAGKSEALCSGYYKLFRWRGPEPIDLISWNEADTWRFAWPHVLPRYFFIACSAWGDQYAIDLEVPDRGVVLFDGFEMAGETVCDSFAEFLGIELPLLAKNPFDSMALQGLQRVGPLALDEGLGFVPPRRLARSIALCEPTRMSLRTVMILNGDLHTQLARMKEGEVVRRMESTTDEKGRPRLRLVVEPGE